MAYPKYVPHWVGGKEFVPRRGAFLDKYDPARGIVLTKVVKGTAAHVRRAIQLARAAYPLWKGVSVVARGEVLRRAAFLLHEKREEIAEIVARECGKARKDAKGEVDAAYECALFFAGEGRRYFGEVLSTAHQHRSVSLVRESIGVGALLTPFNNPFAGIVWKAFPALLCGNAVVIKAHEDTPYAPILLAKILGLAGVPKGAVAVVQGEGGTVGKALVADPHIRFVSLTGSVETGRSILKETANRLAKVSIEAGGKNPFVVCDDADLDRAATLAVQSAFIDAGQRCAAGSRVIVFDAVYDKFKERFLKKVNALRVGVEDGDDFGALINEKRLKGILASVSGAVQRGAALLAGGFRYTDSRRRRGYFLAPTVLENAGPQDEISRRELFGPVTCLYRVKNLRQAIALANDAELKLTGAIHTGSINRAHTFIREYEGGVVRVNGPTHGSEPHMPFGGRGLSGNGWREPGTKALEFYSEWKQVSIDYDPEKV